MAAILIAMTLSACQTATQSLTPREQKLYFNQPSLGRSTSRLVPWTTLTGYMRAAGVSYFSALRLMAGVKDKQLFKSPVAVATGNNRVYVIDRAINTLYSFAWQTKGHDDPDHLLNAHAGLSHPVVENLGVLEDVEDPKDLFVSREGDIYVADGKGKKVVRLDKKGNLVQKFSSEQYLNYPVAVTVDRRNVRLFAADGFFDHILVFNMKGTPLYRIGERGSEKGQFRNIRDVVQGRHGIYISDGMNRRIHVYGLDGTHLWETKKHQFNDATGIALDDEGRIFIADQFESNISIFKDGKLLERFGRRGIGPGEFGSPQNIWYDSGFLYVAEIDNRRVQVLKVLSEDAFQKAAGAAKN